MLTLDGVEPPRESGRLARAAGFARPYLFAAARMGFLLSVGWARSRHRATIVEICRHFGYEYDSREPRALPRISIEALAPGASLVDVREVEGRDGNVSELELIIIARLVRAASPGALFELGTFDGRTTLNMAANAAPHARVVTLDLPRETISTASAKLHRQEERYAEKPESGLRYKGTDMESRIVQLYGDSGSFEFTPYNDKTDFVFVDASHTYRYVINDSLHAMRMLRPEGGTIVWHDYGRWDGVTQALNDLCRAHPAFADTAWIRGTTLAVLQTGSARRTA